MTGLTSSSSSTFQRPLKYTRPARRGVHAVREIGIGLDLPADILELLHQFVKWETLDDLEMAHIFYTTNMLNQEDIGKELDMLKGLSSALGRQYDICMEECEEIEMGYEDVFHKLVEQVPHIKDLPGYEHLTTESEKYQIEEALKANVQNVKLQVEDPALAILIEDLRNKLMAIDNKCDEVNVRMGSIDRLRSTVDNFIQILELAVEQSRFENEVVSEVVVDDREEDKDNSGRSDKKKKKRKRPTKESQKLVERVEEGLLKVLKEVGGKTLESNDASDTEFRKRWDGVVNDFTFLLDDLSTGLESG